MQHAMIISEMHGFSTLVKIRLRALSLDAFSRLYRDFQYRLISTYTFSELSRHSEHNDMRQGYVLINRLGCRAPWRVRWRHPHVRGRKKLSYHFTALHPRYSYSGGSPGLRTTGKFRQTSIENRTPSQVQDYQHVFRFEDFPKTYKDLLSSLWAASMGRERWKLLISHEKYVCAYRAANPGPSYSPEYEPNA